MRKVRPPPDPPSPPPPPPRAAPPRAGGGAAPPPRRRGAGGWRAAGVPPPPRRARPPRPAPPPPTPHRGGTVQRVDPATNRITATVTVGGQLVLETSTSWGGLARIDEATTWLWACSNTDGALHQVDPRAMRVSARVVARCDGGWRTRVGE